MLKRLKNSFFVLFLSSQLFAVGAEISCKDITAALGFLQKTRGLVVQANPQLVYTNIAFGSCGLVCRVNYLRILKKALGKELLSPNEDMISEVKELDSLNVESRDGFYEGELKRILYYDFFKDPKIQVLHKGYTKKQQLTPKDLMHQGPHGQLKIVSVRGYNKFAHFLLMTSFDQGTGIATFSDPNWANDTIFAKVHFEDERGKTLKEPRLSFIDPQAFDDPHKNRYSGPQGLPGYGSNDYRLHDIIYVDKK